MRVLDLGHAARAALADALRGRAGVHELGVLALELLELREQRVVLAVADLGRVEHVIKVIVPRDSLAQLGMALDRRHRRF